jgi:hypothetical protein
MFIPATQLEKSLIAFCEKKISNYDFYKTFLQSNILILHHQNYPVEVGLKKAGRLTEIHYHAVEIKGALYIPVFSSDEPMQRYLTLNQEAKTCLEINAQVFLESLQQNIAVLLNYRSDYGKEFTPIEITLLKNLKIN